MENKNFRRLMLVLVILAAVFIAIGLAITPAQAAMGDSTALARKNSELAPAALGNSNGIDKNSDATTRPDCKSLVAEKWRLENDIDVLKVHRILTFIAGLLVFPVLYCIYRFVKTFKPKRPRCAWGTPLCVLRGLNHEHGECHTQRGGHCMWGTTNCRYSHSDHSQYECKPKTDTPPKSPK